MNLKFCFLFILNLALVNAGPFQLVDDYSDGLLLLDDGTVWFSENEDEDSFIKGDRVDVGAIDAELLGKLEDKTSVSYAFDFLVESEWDGDVDIMYGYISHLNSGEVLFGVNSDPYKIKGGKAVAIARIDEVGHCLVDVLTKTFINDGIILGTTNRRPIVRQVVEVTESGYVFDDGFVLNRSLDPQIDNLELFDKQIAIHIDPSDSMKLSMEIIGDEDISKVTIDCHDQLNIFIDWTFDLEDGDQFHEFISFFGSKELKEAFFPSDLKEGDRLAFHYISNPLFGENFENCFYFVVRE
jgi:hypothetical protein